MATDIEAAQQLVYTAAWKVNNGEYPVREISMAKLLTGEVAWKVADKALQIFGGYGYTMEVPIQRVRLARLPPDPDRRWRRRSDAGRDRPDGGPVSVHAATEPVATELFGPQHTEFRHHVRAFVDKELAPTPRSGNERSVSRAMSSFGPAGSACSGASTRPSSVVRVPTSSQMPWSPRRSRAVAPGASRPVSRRTRTSAVSTSSTSAPKHSSRDGFPRPWREPRSGPWQLPSRTQAPMWLL